MRARQRQAVISRDKILYILDVISIDILVVVHIIDAFLIYAIYTDELPERIHIVIRHVPVPVNIELFKAEPGTIDVHIFHLYASCG